MNRRNFFKISTAAAVASAIPLTAAAAASQPGDRPRRCRVTVLRRECFSDLQSRFLDEPDSGPCPMFHTGQQFEIQPGNIEDLIARGEFCPKAWRCICDRLSEDGNKQCEGRPNPEDSNTSIVCCNDGTRPVVFKVELC